MSEAREPTPWPLRVKRSVGAAGAALRGKAAFAAAPLLLIALVAWGFASPVGASPDDDFHLVSTWCSGSEADECLAGSDDTSRVAPLALLVSACYAFDAEVSASCQGDSLSVDTAPTVDTERGNFNRTYPPLFYAVDGVLASPHIESSVLWIRALNAAILVTLAVAAAIVLPPTRRVAMNLTWLVTSVPLVVFLAASNNPSSWALSGTAVAWITWWAYFEVHGRRRWGVGAVAAVASLVAIGARADAGVYVSFAIVCVAFLARGDLVAMRKVLLLPPLAVMLLGAYVFLSSRQAGAIGGLHEGQAARHGGFSLLANNIIELPSLLAGGFGAWGLGWLDTAMPPLVTWSTAGASIGIAFMGLRRLHRAHGVAIAAIAVVLVAVPLNVLQAGGDPVGANVQPRYIWPLIVLLLGVIIARPYGAVLVIGRLQTWLVGAAVVGANSVALHTNLRRYLTGTDVHHANLNANMEWWWHHAPSPMTVWLMGSFAFACAAALILVDYRRVVRSCDGDQCSATTVVGAADAEHGVSHLNKDAH